MQEKEELRKKAKAIRNSLDMENLSEKIIANIQALEIYKKARHVMIFYPLKHEVDLRGLLKDDKNFYLPIVQGETLRACPYKIGDELITSKFKTSEPTTKPINTSILDIIFVPALMVDNNFYRLGYGGGFYDRFLLQIDTEVTKIVTIPNLLITEKLPFESFDAKIDIIICEINVKKRTKK